MARILMADNPIDWIMFTNAHRYMMKYPGSLIQTVAGCALATMAAGEPLFVIGHADVTGVGVNGLGNLIYNGRQLADVLHAHGLRADQRKITLPGSCEVAQGNFTGFIYELRQQLTRHNYRDVEVKGAVGLAIGGWPQKRVVNPASTNPYLIAENFAMGVHAAQIHNANAAIAALPPVPGPVHLANVAALVWNAVQPFYATLMHAAGAHLMPAHEGFKISR